MVLMAYLAGLVTTPAALVGVVLGHMWWARWRRAQGLSDGPVRLTIAPPPPPPPLPQDRPRINRVSFTSKLGPRRALRSRHPRSG